MIGRNLDELKAHYESLVPLGAKFRTGTKIEKPGKLGYALAIQDYFLEQERAAGTLLPGREWVAMNIESPQLAQSTSKLEDALDFALESTEYVGDVKLDGCRMYAFYTPEHGFEFIGRNRAVADQTFTYYRNQIAGLTGAETKGIFKQSFCLDCELTSVRPDFGGRIVSSTMLSAVVSCLALNQEDSWKAQREAGLPLRLNVFDIVFFNGESVMHWPLNKRLDLVDKIVPAIRDKFGGGDERSGWFLTIPRAYTKDEKLALYAEWAGKNSDGLVLKDLSADYLPVEARGGKRARFIKMKRNISETVGGDIDMFVIGGDPGDAGKANENYISRLHFGVYLKPSGKIHHLASCSGFPQELKVKITEYRDGKPVLANWMLNQVAALNALDISAVSKRFMHATIIRWREGADKKHAHECTFEETLLDTLVGV